MAKLRTIALGLSAALAGATMAQPAVAQSLETNPAVEIRNTGDEARKVCFHRDKTVTLFAIGCVTLAPGENIYWNREGQFTPFKVKVYQKRKLIDKYLYARDLPADTGKILVGTGGRFGFSRFKNIRTQYTLRVCNDRFDDDIWFTLGFETNYGSYSHGWWNIAKGQCRNIGVSQFLKDKHNIPFGTIPVIHYYARTHGDKPLYWTGDSGDRQFCTNTGKKFGLSRDKATGPSCEAGLESITYRRLNIPNQNSNGMLYLTF